MKTLFSIFLAIVSFFSSLTGSPFWRDAPLGVPTLSESVEVAIEPSAVWNAVSGSTAHADADYDDMEYVHYEQETFTAMTDALREAAAGGDIDSVCDLADALYAEYVYIDTLYSLSYLHHCADIYDSYWAEEYAHMSLLASDIEEDMYHAFGEALASPCGAAFAAFLGEIAAAYFSAAEPPFDDEDNDYDERILALEDEYYTLADTMGTLVYDGMTYEQFQTDSDWMDYDTYMDMYAGFQRKICEVFAPTYIELIELRNQQARDAGYENYIDYAYELVYYRAYTPEDAQVFCDAVKPLAREFYENIYYSDLAYEADGFLPCQSGDELIEILGQYLPYVDEQLTEPWEYLTSHGLYDLQSAAPGRLSSGYTINLPAYNSAFIYNTQDGSSYDFITVTHEFGHFCNFYYDPLPNIILWADDLELSEIHSNGLQALFTAFYDEIYGENSYAAEYMCLESLLYGVVTGCLYDEFQREIYAADEPLTAEYLNRVFTSLCEQYGMYAIYDEPLPWNASWAYISHNFELPFYYISYAASDFAALQIWDMAQTDFATAAQVYMDILHRGAYAETYFEVLGRCGLSAFTAEGAVEAVCRPACRRLEALTSG